MQGSALQVCGTRVRVEGGGLYVFSSPFSRNRESDFSFGKVTGHRGYEHDAKNTDRADQDGGEGTSFRFFK